MSYGSYMYVSCNHFAFSTSCKDVGMACMNFHNVYFDLQSNSMCHVFSNNLSANFLSSYTEMKINLCIWNFDIWLYSCVIPIDHGFRAQVTNLSACDAGRKPELVEACIEHCPGQCVVSGWTEWTSCPQVRTDWERMKEGKK